MNRKILEYIDLIHYKTFNYLFGHFTGFLVGAYIASGNVVQLSKLWLIPGFILFNIGSHSSGLYNTWPDMLPRWSIPIYFIYVKTMLVISLTIIILTTVGQSTKGSSSDKSGSDTKKLSPKPMDQSNANHLDWGYNMFIALTRLTTAMNLINYYFIRWDFFTSRIPFETRAFAFVSILII